MNTKLGKMLTYSERLPSLKSDDQRDQREAKW